MKAYELRRYNVFRHNKAVHGSLRPDRVLRLMPKEGLVVEGNVHETIKSPYPYSRLHGKMYHYTYESWDQYFTKFNRYTTSAAKRSVSPISYNAGKKRPPVVMKRKGSRKT